MTSEQGEQVAIVVEPMSSVDLDRAIRAIHPIGTITRAAAKVETPLTNGIARDVTGVDEVTISVGETRTTHFQCVFCADTFNTPTSVRSHLVKHSDTAQTIAKDAKRVADAVLNGKSIYAPYDTDEENVTFMKRVIEFNGPAMTRVLRAARTVSSRKQGQIIVTNDELTTLKAKAGAYDALKAETLKSKFPV